MWFSRKTVRILPNCSAFITCRYWASLLGKLEKNEISDVGFGRTAISVPSSAKKFCNQIFCIFSIEFYEVKHTFSDQLASLLYGRCQSNEALFAFFIGTARLGHAEIVVAVKRWCLSVLVAAKQNNHDYKGVAKFAVLKKTVEQKHGFQRVSNEN
jgi:hypothetical protein